MIGFLAALAVLTAIIIFVGTLYAVIIALILVVLVVALIVWYRKQSKPKPSAPPGEVWGEKAAHWRKVAELHNQHGNWLVGEKRPADACAAFRRRDGAMSLANEAERREAEHPENASG